MGCVLRSLCEILWSNPHCVCYSNTAIFIHDTTVVFMILVFMILVVPVLLLFLYPCRCFQRCLNHFHLRSLALNAFVDVFQGCYKDGTNATRDCRYFAAFQLILRLIFPLVFTIAKDAILSLVLSLLVFGIYTAIFVMYSTI